MFRSASNALGVDGVVFGSAQGLVATPPDAVGKIQTTIGPVTVMRAGGVVARVDVGEFVYQGDAIATGPDGAVEIIFADGTVFNLSSDARAVLNKFAYDPNGTSNSALLSLAQGKFAFIAGKVAKTGGLRIDTPFASIRGSARDRGVGVLTLAALTFAAIEESQAASRHDAFLDDGTITYKDLPHGTFEIVTRDGRVIMSDDPGETIVVDPTGAVTRIPNSSSRMAELQQAQHSALATFSLGQEGGAAGGSSSPGFDIPVQLQPINFGQPHNDAPTEIVTTHITAASAGFIEVPVPQQLKPPVVTPMLGPAAGFSMVTEAFNTTGSTHFDTTPSGTLTFTDFKVTTVSASMASMTWSSGGTPPSEVGEMLAGALSITIEGADTGSGSIATTFGAPDRTFDFLAANETLTIVYDITVTDNGGGSLTQPVTITITGTNDAPALAADASGPHAVTEGLSTTGTLTFTDVDLTDHHAVSTSVASATWSGGATLPSELAAALAGALSTEVSDSAGSGSGSVAVTFSAADSAFDFLGSGQTLTITYDVTVTDNNGVSSTQPIIITVTGTNDAPVAVADVAAVKEDTPPNPVSGNLLANDTDVDSNDTHTVSAVTGGTDNGTTITVVGTYGTLVVTKATGAYTYTLANGQANVQALAEGQQVTDVFTYTNSDNHGGLSSSTLTVTVTGTDNAPVAVADVAAVKEDTPPNPVSGNLLANDTDVDSNDTHTVSAVTGGTDNGTTITVVGTYGTLVVTKATGAYTYTLANGQANVQALAEGQQVTDVFTYTNSDNHGGLSSSTLTVTVTGTNDAPVAVADVAAVKEDTPPNPVSGNLLGNDTDVDSNDTHTVSAVTGGTDNGTTITVVGTYGTLVVTKATGAYTYTLANGQANVQALAEGQQVTDVFTYTNSDNHGGLSSSTLTVTVTGTDNAPVAVADVAAVKEDTLPNPVSGNLLANDTDVDSNDTHTVSAVTGGTDNGTTITVVGTYGTLVVTKATGAYTYTLANGQANVQALAEGQQVTDVFTYTNSDNHGGLSSSTLTVTVTGTNDAPVAVADVAAVKEDTPPNPVSGNLLANDTDVDSNDTHTVSAVTGGTDNGTTITVVGTYGTLVVTKATGAYTYTLANGQANVQALAEGQQVTDVFTYTNSDNHGGLSSSTLTVTVTGTDNAPVAVADVAAVKEDTPPNPVSGNLLANDTDVDSNDTHTVSAVTGGTDNGTTITVVGTYGTLVVTKATGAYTYTLANGQANVQALAEGQQVTDVFTYTNSDNHGGLSSSTLTVTVTGTNDATVAVADVAAVKEDTLPNPVSGNLLANDTDVDSNDTHTVSAVTGGTDNGTTITVVGTYGTLVVTKATGAYTYTLANGQANVQALAEGQQVTDVFTYANSDNHGGLSSSTLTVTVTGTNDAPVAVADVAAVKEDTPPNPVSGNLLGNDTDVDSNDTHTVSAVTGGTDNGTTITVVGTYGTLVVTKATGAYTYTLANGQANVQALAEGQQVTDVFTYTNSDNHGGLSSSSLTVTVTGTIDARVIDPGTLVLTGDTLTDPLIENDGRIVVSTNNPSTILKAHHHWNGDGLRSRITAL